MTEPAPIIAFENVDKFYGSFHALKDISITVREGERMVICGPSGSGKSTLIRCINGLEFHNSGVLTVDGIEVHEHAKEILNLRQEVGMVFQQFNLFPHLTVLENLMIGPMKVRKVSKDEAEATANLDSESEEAVREALADLMRGRTTVIVAHRLSTVVDADQIAMIEDGRVTGTGSHQDLLANHFRYRRLVERQAV